MTNHAGILCFHGGGCCGIKIIRSLDSDPDEYADKLDPNLMTVVTDEGEYVPKNPYFSTPYPHARPSEPLGDRVLAYLDWLDENRPRGICEIVLADYQKPGWDDFLGENGFTCVTTSMNSNSGNTIYVYHRLSNKHPYDPDEEYEDPFEDSED